MDRTDQTIRKLDAVGGSTTVMNVALNKWESLHHISRPPNILEEVQEIVRLMLPRFDFGRVISVYQDAVRLFGGKYDGYSPCNTGYHDWRHTEECLLEMARLMHGASVTGHRLTQRGVALGLISAILHDTGYIQLKEDNRGTGAKYTMTHVERSIDFTENYFARRNFSLTDFHFCKNCLHCTGISVNISEIKFESSENELLGKILGTADLIGQMSDPTYLEKLPILYKEFREGGVADFQSELDLLKHTPLFWEDTKKRFMTEFGAVDAHMRQHFRVRWGIDRDLEREAIERNISCLTYILEHHPQDYRRYLRSQRRALQP